MVLWLMLLQLAARGKTTRGERAGEIILLLSRASKIFMRHKL
jgi:hypothetical protein